MNKKAFCDHYHVEIPRNCPFCGYSDYEMTGKKQVKCLNCGLVGPVADDVIDSVEKWNSQFSFGNRCLFCGSELDANNECSNCSSVIPQIKQLGTDDDSYCCCYIDLLGFSSYSSSFNIQDSVRIIENYAHILQQRSIEEIAESFLCFHPASDGIFILSREPDQFVADLCKFCHYSFEITSIPYLAPEDPKDVAKVTVPVISVSGVRKVEQHWFPALFSGGISFGQIVAFKQESLYFKESKMIPNYVGKPLTAAVKLQHSDKNATKHGSRIFCDEDFVSRLSADSLDKFIFSHDGIYELLWPISYFIDENDIEFNLSNGVRSLFESVLNFYYQYKDNQRLEAVYFNTLKMIYESQNHYLRYRNASQEELSYGDRIISNILQNKEMSLLFEELKKPESWK